MQGEGRQRRVRVLDRMVAYIREEAVRLGIGDVTLLLARAEEVDGRSLATPPDPPGRPRRGRRAEH